MNIVNVDEEEEGLVTAMWSPPRMKTREEVTLEDVVNLDALAITGSETVNRHVPDVSRMESILDITSFKPFKPLSHREERASKRTNECSGRGARGRKLPFIARKKETDFQQGEAMPLGRQSMADLEKDYYQSLLDANGKFKKYAPKMVCQTEVLAVEFRMQLADGRIWRTFRMEGSTNFYLLRRAILDLMGWSEEVSWSFMYISRKGHICMVGQSGPLKSDDEVRNEEQLVIVETLNEYYCRFCFLYDLQTGWRVDLFLRKVLDRDENVRLPICVRGRGYLHFPLIRHPTKLAQVCRVLKDAEAPKRGKYLDKYGDILTTPSHLAATPFPSFYEQDEIIEAPPPVPIRRRRRKLGPFIVIREEFPEPEAPIFRVQFCEWPPIIQAQPLLMTPLPSTPRPENPVPTVLVSATAIPQDATLGQELVATEDPPIEPRPKRKRRAPNLETPEPAVKPKKPRRERKDSVLVINFEVIPPEEKK